MSDRIILATGANARYLPRILAYLQSIEKHGEGFETYLVCVGCPADRLPDLGLGHIQVVALAGERAIGQPGNDCVQHGAFLEAIPGSDDDLVVFTDGDMVLQRLVSLSELELLRALGDGVVGVSYNAGPNDTLLLEAERLGPRTRVEVLVKNLLGGNPELPVYNTGVIAARRGTYRRLYEEYIARWAEFGQIFSHYARQQWLLSALIGTEGFIPLVLPYTFHMHGCYPLPPGAEIDSTRGWVTYGGELVLFRHHL